jgi:GNAT superfamily N-acetyltransferase
MQIVRAGLPELDQVVRLFEAYRVHFQQKADRAAATAFIQGHMENHTSVIFLALSEEGTGVGFTQLYPFFSSLRMKKLWLLNDLFVSPDYRGKGVSIRLIDQAKELAQKTGAAGLMLETEKVNDIGNQLYPRTGFHLYESSNFYVWDCAVVS